MTQIKPPERDIKPTDSCAQCGLRRASRALEATSGTMRLCDECYWGKEFVPESPTAGQ